MTAHDHSEGIRLHAERVVRAYNDLRGTAKSSDFTSDDFPVDKSGLANAPAWRLC
jgi:hypothetical protein